MGLFLNMKRGKNYIDLHYNGKKIATIRVDEQNRGNTVVLSLDAVKELRFKVVKEQEKEEIDENFGNKEVYNV